MAVSDDIRGGTPWKSPHVDSMIPVWDGDEKGPEEYHHEKGEVERSIANHVEHLLGVASVISWACLLFSIPISPDTHLSGSKTVLLHASLVSVPTRD